MVNYIDDLDAKINQVEGAIETKAEKLTGQHGKKVLKREFTRRNRVKTLFDNQIINKLNKLF